MTSTSQKMQIAVSGYYGCGNAGDEAVLAGIRESFVRQAGDKVELLALSQNPVETAQLHEMRSVDRMNLTAVRRVFQECDLLLSGGGSLLQDTTSVRSLLYYLWVIRLAYSQQVPVMFYAQGIGPLRRSFSRRLVQIVANRAAYITVRDEPSATLLATLGVTRPTIEVTADPAFALSPAPDARVEEVCRIEGLSRKEPMIGVALRPWGGQGESPIKDYAELLKELAGQSQMRVVLLPMQVPGDVVFAEQVVQETGTPEIFPVVRGAYPPHVLLGLVARMQSVVAMRLHTLIFAARTGVPPFALSYDPKVENLMNGLGLGNSLEHWRGFDPEEVAGRVTLLLKDREAHRAVLLEKVSSLERHALRNADCALHLITRTEHTARLLSEQKPDTP